MFSEVTFLKMICWGLRRSLECVLCNLQSFNKQHCCCFRLAFCLKHVWFNLSQKQVIFLIKRHECTWRSLVINNVSAAVEVLMKSVVSWWVYGNLLDFKWNRGKFAGMCVPLYCDLAHLEYYQLELIPFSRTGLTFIRSYKSLLICDFWN